MQLNTYKYPLLYIASAFMTGISIGRLPLYAALLVWVISAIALYISCNKWITITILLLTSFTLGGALRQIAESKIKPNNLSTLFDKGILTVDDTVIITGTLLNHPEKAPNRYYLNIDVEKLSIKNKDRNIEGNIRIAVPLKNSDARTKYVSLDLKYGTKVIMQCRLKNKIGFRNPGEPDFTELLNFKGFEAIGSIKSPSYIYKIGNTSLGLKTPLRFLYRIRSELIEVIITHFKQPASGILVASLFGNKYYLTQETAESFRIGGTFHLLIISGMHISVIAIFVFWISHFLSNSRIAKYLIVTVFMWAYTLMIGAEPAVTRAVIMLSLIFIGRAMFRASNGINIIAASAIILLAWNPRDLFNPGFQLSFITVAIIFAIIQPLLTKLKAIGEWDLSSATPYPPRANKIVKHFAEALFWNESGFRKKRKQSSVKYKLIKSPLSRFLSKSIIPFQERTFSVQNLMAWFITIVISAGIIQIALLPLSISLFHRVSLISPITNVIESIFISMLMCGGAIAALTHYIFSVDAIKLDAIVNFLGNLMLKSSEPLHKYKWSSIRMPDGGESAYIYYIVFFAVIIIVIFIINEWNPLAKGDGKYARSKRITGIILSVISITVICFITFLFLLPQRARDHHNNRLSITFLDVGQGDSVLIEFPNGSVMLLDAGGMPRYSSKKFDDKSEDETNDTDDFTEDRIGIAEASVMPFLWNRGISKLDWIVASHEHWDHIEGFIDISKYFSVNHALKSYIPNAPPGPFEKTAFNSHIPIRKLKTGDRLKIAEVTVQTITPFNDAPLLSENNNSLTLKITYGNRSFLLTGDIEKEIEERLVTNNSDIHADVLKVAHHGSKSSSTLEFLKRVKPEHAVISVAHPSPFKHPHKDTLNNLNCIGAKIWRTDTCGAITISTDGNDLKISTFVQCF